MFSRLQLTGADGGYRGIDFVARVQQVIGVRPDVIERDPAVQGFQKLPRRWVVERFAWLGEARQLSKDYDDHRLFGEAMIDATLIRIMVWRLATCSS